MKSEMKRGRRRTMVYEIQSVIPGVKFPIPGNAKESYCRGCNRKFVGVVDGEYLREVFEDGNLHYHPAVDCDKP